MTVVVDEDLVDVVQVVVDDMLQEVHHVIIVVDMEMTVDEIDKDQVDTKEEILEDHLVEIVLLVQIHTATVKLVLQDDLHEGKDLLLLEMLLVQKDDQQENKDL